MRPSAASVSNDWLMRPEYQKAIFMILLRAMETHPSSFCKGSHSHWKFSRGHYWKPNTRRCNRGISNRRIELIFLLGPSADPYTGDIYAVRYQVVPYSHKVLLLSRFFLSMVKFSSPIFLLYFHSLTQKMQLAYNRQQDIDWRQLSESNCRQSTKRGYFRLWWFRKSGFFDVPDSLITLFVVLVVQLHCSWNQRQASMMIRGLEGISFLTEVFGKSQINARLHIFALTQDSLE